MGMIRLDASHLPPTPGTYVLFVRVDQPLTFAAGRLGKLDLAGGLYVYAGSAHGAGGLRARLGRHLRAGKPLHWHIDYLTAQAPIAEIWLTESPERLECAWARTLAALGTIPAAHFGSSDCVCPAHLIALAENMIPAAWAALGYPTRVSLLGGDAKGDRPAEH